MSKYHRTFRIQEDIGDRIERICTRRGDWSYHLNNALREYINNHELKNKILKSCENSNDSGA